MKRLIQVVRIISIIIIISTALFTSIDRVKITPSTSNLMVALFSDSEDLQVVGSEKLLLNVDKKRITFNYKLGATNEFPYIGFSLERDSLMWNLSRFDQITIAVNPSLTDKFTLQLSTFVEGFTDSSNGLSYRLFEQDIDAVSSASIKLPLTSLETPTWWFASNNINVNHNRNSLKDITQIRFQSHPLSKRTIPLRLQFNSITFGHSAKRQVPFYLIGVLGLLLAQHINKRRKIPFVPVVMNKRSEEELTLLEEFFGREYTRLDISLQKVVLETGLSETTIRSHLKTFHNMGFKEYLNSIRLTEGARLLRESDRQIAEIALYVGFRHPTTFTKLFRQYNSQSPSEYREKNSV